MPNSVDIAYQLEEIRGVIENSDRNYFLTVWIPIIVVFIGAFIAHIFSLIEKKRQRESLKYTVVLWLRESIKPIEHFVGMLQMHIDESRSATVLDSKRLFTPTFDLQCIKEFPIDKMSDALVARLKVNEKEKIEVGENFYALFDLIKNMDATQSQFFDGHSDYNRKMDYLKHEWDKCHTEYLCLTKQYLLAEDATDAERQFFNKTQVLFLEMWNQIAEAGGVFQRDIMRNFIQKMSDAYTQAPPTQRVLDANESLNNVRIVLHNMESLHTDMIRVCQTIHAIMSESKEELSGLVSFYEHHKIKSIFSFSNKLS